MTVDGYSKIMEAKGPDGIINSDKFRAGAGEHRWSIDYLVVIEDQDDDEVCAVGLRLHRRGGGDEVKTRYDVALLNRAGERIASVQSLFNFSGTVQCFKILEVLNCSPLLGDTFQISCDLTVVEEIAAVAPPDLHRHLAGLLASSQVGLDVTFQVGGELFTAHKNILAARSPLFMAELFDPGKEKTLTHVRIHDMEPRVFKALLHFIYTESLPEVSDGDGDKAAMAQGLLVAADKYGIEKLKSICGDMLCNHIDARTAMDLMLLADSHGCRRLKQACTRIIKDMLAKVATP